jgi:hypothetical protein
VHQNLAEEGDLVSFAISRLSTVSISQVHFHQPGLIKIGKLLEQVMGLRKV